MRTAKVTIVGLSPYSASKFIDVEKNAKEGADAFEKRTWRERIHADGEGNAYIPGIAFKKALDTAASKYAEKIKGRGNTTYSKFFASGIMVLDSLPLGLKKDDVQGEWLFVPSDGKPGGGKRVKKCFPVVHKWGGTVSFLVLDDTITEEVFERTITQAFAFVGIGRWRPERGGMYGRAEVKEVRWS